MKNKVFLGGTCAHTTWRDELIPMLKVDYFNPVVSDWTSECQQEEEHQKSDECNIHLYVITPSMKGVFSIAEIIESSHMKNKITVVYIMNEEIISNAMVGIKEIGIHHTNAFTNEQLKSLKSVSDMAKRNGAFICYSLEHVAEVINEMGKENLNESKSFVDEDWLREHAYEWTNFINENDVKIRTIALECAMLGYKKAKEELIK